MDTAYDDRFVVFALRHRPDDTPHRVIEREVVTCPSYEEAQQVRRAYQAAGCDCVIRYMGEAGGGD
ncbi:MAG TPA: hypothetical protein VEL76_29505 [Gemmataceae bacterium]|nr:hypothetical protein [Gemmataceae bacterium]